MKMDQQAEEPSPLQSFEQDLSTGEKHKFYHSPKDFMNDHRDVAVSPVPNLLRQSLSETPNGEIAKEDPEEIEYCSYSENDGENDIYELANQSLDDDDERESFDDASSNEEDQVERAQRFQVLERAASRQSLASRQSIASEAFSLPLDLQGDVSSLECDTPDDNDPFDLVMTLGDSEKLFSNDSIYSMVLTKQSKLWKMYGTQTEEADDNVLGESPVTELRKRERRKNSSQRSTPRRFTEIVEPNTPTSTNNNNIRDMQALREVFRHSKMGKTSPVRTRCDSDLGVKLHDHLVLEGDNESSEDGDNRGGSSRPSRPSRIHRGGNKHVEGEGKEEEKTASRGNYKQGSDQEDDGELSSIPDQSMLMAALPLLMGRDGGETNSNSRALEREISKKSQDSPLSTEGVSTPTSVPSISMPQVSSSKRSTHRYGPLPPYEHEGEWGKNLPPELDLVEARKYIAQLAAGVPDTTPPKTPISSLDISLRSDTGNDRRTHDGSGLSPTPKRFLRSIWRSNSHSSRRLERRHSFTSATSEYTEIIVDDDGEIFVEDDEIVDYDGNGLNRNFISSNGRQSILDDHSEYTEVVVDEFAPVTGCVGGNNSSHHRRRLRPQTPTYDDAEVIEYEIESPHMRGAMGILKEEIVIEEEEEIIED